MNSSRSNEVEEELIQPYKSGVISIQQFWTGLEFLVSKGDITRGQERQIFWESHSWNKQAQLKEKCPHFDPQDEIWGPNVPETSKLEAKQIMRETIASITVKESARHKPRHSYLTLLIAIIGAAGGIMMIVSAGVGTFSNGDRAALAVIGAFLTLVDLVLLIMTLKRCVSSRRKPDESAQSLNG